MTPGNRLAPGRERDLVAAAARGDPTAAGDLVAAFLPRITGLAHRFPATGGIGRAELVQEGVAGLLVAARAYDPARQTPFWAYASFRVRKQMQELVADLARPVVLSDRAVRALAAVRAARLEHQQARGEDPTATQLGRATGLGRGQVEALERSDRAARSTEEPAVPDGAADTLGDRLADPSSEQAYEAVLDRLDSRRVHALTAQLPDRERAVVRAHFGLGQPAQPLSRIGAVLGVTAERARQIEAGALVLLRQALASSPAPSGEQA